MAEAEPAALAGRWLHSHEEDSGGETVYRPAGFAFPPARGRQGFELRADGSYADLGPGPTDKPEETEGGAWALEGGRLTLGGGAVGSPERVLEVVAAEPDRLVVRE